MTEFSLVADHHRILDLSADASLDQIKNQYKILVRIYHPDRYQDATTRRYAEHKLKVINHAYSALTKGDTALQTGPRPIAYKNQLDFGLVPEKSTQTLSFQVENRGGLVHDTAITLSEENSWFYVKAGVPLFPGIPFPMEFTVAADTHQLTAGQSYVGWIDVRLDEATTRVSVSLTVAEPPPAPSLFVRYMLHMALLLLIFGVLYVRHATAQPLNSNPPVVGLPVEKITIAPVELAKLTKVVQVEPTVVSLLQLMPTPTPVGELIGELVGKTEQPAAPTTLPLAYFSTSVLVIIPNAASVHARLAPAVTETDVQLLPGGTHWFATGRTLDKRWLRILLADQQTAWVFTEAVQVEADRLERLLVATDL
jgi:DnaJ domain